jgi:hypothetical protein
MLTAAQQHSSGTRHCAARSHSWLAHGHAGPALVLTHTALGGTARLASAPTVRGRMEVLTIGSRSIREGKSGGWSGLRGDGGLGRPCDGAWQSSGARADVKRPQQRCSRLRLEFKRGAAGPAGGEVERHEKSDGQR